MASLSKPATASSGPRPAASWLNWIEQRSKTASLLLGAIAALGLPPLFFIPGLLGFAAWLRLLMQAPSRRQAFLIGWCFGLGYFMVGLYWIAIAFFTDAEKFGALAIPAVFLLCAVMAVFPGFAGLAFGLVRPKHPVAGAIVLALTWTGAEWLRAHFLWGFPWNLVGYVWIGVLPVSQTAAWIGIYGLSILTVLAGALFITSFTMEGRSRFAGPASSTALLLLLATIGMLRLQGAAVEHQPDIHLRLVQANIDQFHKWDPDLRAASFQRHLSLTATPSSAPVTHVIWPETASAYVLDQDEVARELIAEVVPRDGLVITGFNRFDLDNEPKRAWNSLGAVDEAEELVAVYDKRRLVPFGEFLPWRFILSQIGLKKLTLGTIDFHPGDSQAPLSLGTLPPFNPLICYEAIFTGDVTGPDQRPVWLLNVTNDAWFGHSSGPYQHLAMARMRAIEEGLPLVRSANTGISAIIDPYGRIEAELGLGETGVLDAGLPNPLEKPTIYALWRHVPILLMVVIGLFSIFMIEKVFKNRYVKFR